MNRKLAVAAAIAAIALSGCTSGRFEVPDLPRLGPGSTAPAPLTTSSPSPTVSPGDDSTPSSAAPEETADPEYTSKLGEAFQEMYDNETDAIWKKYGLDPDGQLDDDVPSEFYDELEGVGDRISLNSMPIAGGDQSGRIEALPENWKASEGEEELALIYSLLKSMSFAYSNDTPAENLPVVHFASIGLYDKVISDRKALPRWDCADASSCLSDVSAKVVSVKSEQVFSPSSVSYVRVRFTSGGDSSDWVFGVTRTGPAFFVSSVVPS